MELAGFQNSYETEIDEILKDAQRKLSEFKMRFDTGTGQNQQAIEELKRQLLDERASAADKQSTIQRQMKEQQEVQYINYVII